MSTWKGEEELKEVLATLATAKGVSANRIKAACTTCMKWSKEYKRVVHAVEMVMWKSDVEHRLAYLYLIDALIRASQTKYGDDKDHFAKRFGQHLHHTLSACRKVPDDHKANVKRVVLEWQKRGVFSLHEIEQAGGTDFVGDGPLDAPPPANEDKIASLLSGWQKLKQQEQQGGASGSHPEASSYDPTNQASPPRHHRDIISAAAYGERSAPPPPMHAESRYADMALSHTPSRFDPAPSRYADMPPNTSRYDHPPPSSRFDQPQHSANPRFNQPPQQGNSRFDQPPHQGNSRFDQPPHKGNSRFDQPPQLGTVRFDQPPHQGNSRFDQPPHQGNSRFEPPRQGSSRYDQPPQAPGGRFDPPSTSPFPRFDGPPQQSYNGPPPPRHHGEFGYPPRGSSPRANPAGQDSLKRARSRSRSRSPPKRRTVPCRDFPFGRCSRGNQCRFAHDVDGSTHAPPMHGKSPQVKTRLCNTYPNCRFGDRCTFAHGERELGTSAYSNDDKFSQRQPRSSSPGRFQPFQQATPPPTAPGGMVVNNTVPPPTTTPAPGHLPPSNDQPPPTRQRRSRWEDKKTAPADHQNPHQTRDEPPKHDLPPREVDDEHAEDTAAAPEFTLEYDDDN